MPFVGYFEGYFNVSALNLGDLRFNVTEASGTKVDFKDFVQGFSVSDNVNTAGMQAQFVLSGPLDQIVQIGDEGSSCRVEAHLLDNQRGLIFRPDLHISLLWDGLWENITDERLEGSLTRYITGFDIAKMLTDTEDDWVFQGKSLSEIVLEIGAELELPLNNIPSTTTKLGQIIGRGSSVWTIFQEAIQRHSYITGNTYRVLAEDGKITMRRQGGDHSFWTFDVGGALRTARREKSTANVINLVRIYGRAEGENRATLVDEVYDASSARLYGLKQRVVYLGKDGSVEEVKRRAQYQLEQFRGPEERFTITGLIVPGLRAGDRVRVLDEEWGIDQLYFAESVESVWDPGDVSASLTLQKEPIEPGLDLADEVLAV